MKKEDQVCSLELAKKLKELGVKQESLFVWRERKYNTTKPMVSLFDSYDDGMYEVEGWVVVAPAYTVAELGEMLPLNNIPRKLEATYENGAWCQVHKENSCWSVHYIGWNEEHQKERSVYPRITAFTEADARAKCLVYLLENKLIEAEMCLLE